MKMAWGGYKLEKFLKQSEMKDSDALNKSTDEIKHLLFQEFLIYLYIFANCLTH